MTQIRFVQFVLLLTLTTAIFVSPQLQLSANAQNVVCTTGSQSISSNLVSSFPPVVVAGGNCDLDISASITGNGSGTDDPALLGQGNATITQNSGLVVAQGSCLLYTSPSPRDATLSRMPSSA